MARRTFDVIDVVGILQLWYAERSKAGDPRRYQCRGRRLQGKARQTRRRPDHAEVVKLLGRAGRDGAEIGKHLRRFLPMKTKAEYEPDKIPLPAAAKAVERAQTCVAIASRVVTPCPDGAPHPTPCGLAADSRTWKPRSRR